MQESLCGEQHGRCIDRDGNKRGNREHRLCPGIRGNISHLERQLETGAFKGRVLVLLGLQEQDQVGLVLSLNV